ncbi:hypothetical protein DPV73_12200 [Leptospira mayottensis]|nr:hypothetical protein DPV73_12200 [Leptospira mayottensis]
MEIEIDLFLNFYPFSEGKFSTGISILRGETLLILLHKFDFLQEELICSNRRFSMEKNWNEAVIWKISAD